MKVTKILLICFLLVRTIFSNAQEMKEGFSYLEKGDFGKAEVFFKTVLKLGIDPKLNSSRSFFSELELYDYTEKNNLICYNKCNFILIKKLKLFFWTF